MSKVFSLQGRGLSLNTRADVEPLLADVDPATVEEVHFGGNTIGVEAAQAIAEFLEKTKVLKVADFADIFTGRLISEIPQALSAICDALIDKTSLVEIDLSDNAFGGRSAAPMVPFLSKNRAFQVLRLNNNGLGPAGGAIIADALLQSAAASARAGEPSRLRTVICGRNRLEDGSAGVWAEAFRAHGGLVEVRMPQNGIRMDGIAALVRGLAACADLARLDLQDNTFGELGAAAMADTLRLWPALMFLNLSDCVLADEGAVSPVVEALAEGSNPRLEVLHLQNNNMETASFELLAKAALEGLPLLRTLELQWNDVEEDDDAIETLVGVLTGRGGKVWLDDDEEEEDEEEEEVLAEEEAEAEAEAEAAEAAAEEEVKEREGESTTKPTVPAITDKTSTAVDDLAELLTNATIR